MAQSIEIRLLGRPAILKEGQEITAHLPAKGVALLAWMALGSRRAPRAAVAALLWPETDDEAARANLRLTLSRMRPLLGELIAADRTDLQLNEHASWAVDALEMRRLLREGRDAQAISAYTGDLLAGLSLSDAPEFEQWAATEREALRREVIAACARLSAKQAAAALEGDREAADAAAESLRRWIALAPWDEEAHRRLVGLLAWSGRRAEALAQADLCRRTLLAELDVEPDDATRALEAAIRRGEAPMLAWAQAELTALPAGQANARAAEPAAAALRAPAPVLRPEVDSLLGRQREREEVAALYSERGARLVTLIGPGGIGKSSLSHAVAADLLDLHAARGQPLRLARVELAGVAPSQPDEVETLLLSSVARALELDFGAPVPPRDLLLGELGRRHLLLVLDNFEQLRAGASLLHDLLAAAPGLLLLVTSRVRLGLADEWLYELQGLAWPQGGSQESGEARPANTRLPAAPAVDARSSGAPAANAPHLDAPALDAEQWPAMALFARAAHRLQPSFDAAANASAVVDICRLVEGQPLALLLAATWTRALSCREIADRLAGNLDLLSTSGAEVGPRHRSLRAVWDASWALLDAHEQEGLRRLSIFAGSFNAAAAQAVAGASTRMLATLVDHALVQRAAGRGDDRFVLHALLRQYAAGKLAEHPDEVEATQDALVAWFAALLAETDMAASARVNEETLARLDAELDNLRAAWIYAQRSDGAIALPFIEGFTAYLRQSFWNQEAMLVLKQALLVAGLSQAERAHLERLLGDCAYSMGRLGQARRHYEAALALYGLPMPSSPAARTAALIGGLLRLPSRLVGPRSARTAQLSRQAALDLCHVGAMAGQIAFFDGRRADLLLMAPLVRNIAEAGRLDDWRFVAYGLWSYVTISMGLRSMSDSFYRRGMALEEACALPTLRGWALNVYANSRVVQGQWEEALAILERSIALVLPTRNVRLIAETYSLIGKAASYCGAYARADKAFLRLYEVAEASQSLEHVHWSTMGHVEIAMRRGEEAAALIQRLLPIAEVGVDYAGPGEHIRCMGLLARLHMIDGDRAAAVAAARRALPHIRAMQVINFWAIEGYDGAAKVLIDSASTRHAGEGATADGHALARDASEALNGLKRFVAAVPCMRARLELRQGDMARGQGRRSRARGHYTRALALADALGMPWEVDEARRALERDAE